MFVMINDATLASFEQVLNEQAEGMQCIRIFKNSLNPDDKTFGLTIDKKALRDVEDKSHEVCFVMNKDLYRQVGDMMIRQKNEGYVVKPVMPIQGPCKTCQCDCNC